VQFRPPTDEVIPLLPRAAGIDLPSYKACVPDRLANPQIAISSAGCAIDR